jgi:hypothetical protein
MHMNMKKIFTAMMAGGSMLFIASCGKDFVTMNRRDNSYLRIITATRTGICRTGRRVRCDAQKLRWLRKHDHHDERRVR